MNSPSHAKWKPWLHCVLLAAFMLVGWSVQSAPQAVLSIGGVSPVLVLSLTACIGVIYGELAGGVFGLCAGLFMEIYATPSVGFHIALLAAVGIGCGLLIRHVFMNNLLASFVLILAVCLVYFFLLWLLYEVMLGGNGGWEYLLRFSLPAAGYTAVVGFVVYPLIRWMHRYW